MKKLVITHGCYARKIDKNFPFNDDEEGRITENFTASFDTFCDKSVLVDLNIEFQNGTLIIVEKTNNSYYTNIVKDLRGRYYAVSFDDTRI